MQHNTFIGGRRIQYSQRCESIHSSIFRLLWLQWKQDAEASIKFVQQAIDIDDKCDFAHETMGTIEVQRYGSRTFLNVKFSLGF